MIPAELDLPPPAGPRQHETLFLARIFANDYGELALFVYIVHITRV